MSTEKRIMESTARRALAVQEIYLEHSPRGLSNAYIYRHYIRPVFFISERTFYRYLDRNAKKEIRQIENNHES